jgi:hypothetical protein
VLVETMKGRGMVTSPSGEKVPVTYNLRVDQKQIHAGSLNDATATIPGMKTISGTVLLVHSFGVNGLLLEMEDGRRVRFFFTDMHGSMATNGGIEEP